MTAAVGAWWGNVALNLDVFLFFCRGSLTECTLWPRTTVTWPGRVKTFKWSIRAGDHHSAEGHGQRATTKKQHHEPLMASFS